MKPVIVAEAASNHNGEVRLAKEMIHAAKEAGADMIKFQSYLGKNVRDGHPDKDRFLKVNLSDDDHHELMAECRKAEIGFLTTCFDIERIEFLKTLRMKFIKVASYDISSHRMIGILAENFDHLIVSTGSAKLSQIAQTADLLKAKKADFTLLHCVTLYPTPPERARLGRMHELKKFTPFVGFSDHSLGTMVPKVAIAMGAVMIEKHFTLDKKMAGKSHHLACDPKELRDIVEYARFYEKVFGGDFDEFRQDEMDIRNFYHGMLGEGI